MELLATVYRITPLGLHLLSPPLFLRVLSSHSPLPQLLRYISAHYESKLAILWANSQDVAQLNGKKNHSALLVRTTTRANPVASS